MNAETLEALDWRIRLAVYHFIVVHERAPSVGEIAAELGIDAERALAGFERLHARHALLLSADNISIQMANPFSGVPTPFRVHVAEHTYFANCAWDSFGIAAMLGRAARVETSYADTTTPLVIEIGQNGIASQPGIVHFAVPFREWYDDLVYT